MNAINKYVIAAKEEQDKTSSSGIILSSSDQKTVYTVVNTTEETKELKGKQIYIKDYTTLEDDYIAVHIDDIVAWK